MGDLLSVLVERDERLVAELHRLGVRHLVRLYLDAPLAPVPPLELMSALAQHPQARFRSALILLFLRRPSFSQFVPTALAWLDNASATTLRLYYQAALYLQPELEGDLRAYSDDHTPLPDLFSAELGVPPPGRVSTAEALEALGQRHVQLTELAYNWSGAYRQNIPLFIRQLKRFAYATLTP